MKNDYRPKQYINNYEYMCLFMTAIRMLEKKSITYFNWGCSARKLQNSILTILDFFKGLKEKSLEPGMSEGLKIWGGGLLVSAGPKSGSPLLTLLSAGRYVGIKINILRF